MIGPASNPDINPDPGTSAIANAVSIISELPFEPFSSLHSSQHCTAMGITIATRTVIEGVKRLSARLISVQAKTNDTYDGLDSLIIPKAIRLPNPVFCNVNPKKSAGISVHTADCAKPENTTFGASPTISPKKAKTKPPTAYGKLNGLNIQMHSAIMIPPSMVCAVSSNSAIGRIVIVTIAINTIRILNMCVGRMILLMLGFLLKNKKSSIKHICFIKDEPI